MPNGASITARDSLDFVVDGQRLSTRVGGDYASCLGSGNADWEAAVVDKLLLRAEPDVQPNRVALYICPECGDLGCGAITAVVEREDEVIVWHTFGHETDYEERSHFEGYEHLGPFRFDAVEYERVLRGSYASKGEASRPAI